MSGYVGIIAPLSSSLCYRGNADLACNVFIALPAHTHKRGTELEDTKDGEGHRQHTCCS